MTQHGRCYSAVSSSLKNPLPDCSNYSPFRRTHYTILQINASLSLRARPFTKPLCWRLILHCCSALLQNLVGNSGEMQCLEEAEQQAEASVDIPYPPHQISNLFPFCLFSLYLYPLSAPFLNPHSLFSLKDFSSKQRSSATLINLYAHSQHTLIAWLHRTAALKVRLITSITFN